MIKNKNIAIIGGGIIGLAVAYKLSEQGAFVHVFEKEKGIGLHQSGRNSGVLHCGLYYQPGSLKAQLSVNGIREMISFCKTHEIAHDVCGKVVVATTQKEVQALDQLASRGNENGLTGLKYLSKEELKLREPFVRALKTLLVPEEGIVDYKAMMKKMVELIENNKGQVSYNSTVNSVDQSNEKEVLLSTSNNTYTFDYLISCSGLWSDKTFTNLTQLKPPLRIVPFRGEYLKFKQGFKDHINHLVYPVPDAQFPFLGVHFTRMIDGSREVGPNAVLALKREGYSKSSFSLKDSYESLTYPGLLRFVKNNFRFSINEFRSSIFMKDFIAKAQKMIPDVDASMLETGPAGVRAQAISKEGKLQMDFNIIRKGRQIHVLNAPSPGATASLSIADHIIKNYL
ncbi:L-2-hydroxyglutarate oxidase [Flavobacteriaceae bacterium]|nr:L-2-hydroxyglutarate oxidase [Flavobacteriaceae bacterium]MDB4715215.1 L-2-hydroxyglutarate oxidase [Flavobacteriaceae bacterium]